MTTRLRILVVDANVLIDYAKSSPEILALAALHLAELVVPSPIMDDEVEDLDADTAVELGIKLLDPTVDQLTEAGALAAGPGGLSFYDWLCVVIARDAGDHWVVLTNDGRLASMILARHVVTVSRFGAAPIDCANLAQALAATATGDCLEFTYENLQGVTREVHAVPARCVLIKGEWYCIAWAGSLKNFRVARMKSARRVRNRPDKAPACVSPGEVDALLKSAFFATASQRPADKARVVLAVSPQAWPHIRDRRWGDNQVLAEKR